MCQGREIVQSRKVTLNWAEKNRLGFTEGDEYARRRGRPATSQGPRSPDGAASPGGAGPKRPASQGGPGVSAPSEHDFSFWQGTRQRGPVGHPLAAGSPGRGRPATGYGDRGHAAEEGPGQPPSRPATTGGWMKRRGPKRSASVPANDWLFGEHIGLFDHGRVCGGAHTNFRPF